MRKDLIAAALRGANVSEFSANDVNKNAIDELCKELNIDPNNVSPRELLKYKSDFYNILAEEIDEILPKDLTNVMGAFAEVRTFGREEDVIFTIKKGKRRARLSIKRGAPHGIYRAAQYDSTNLSIDTELYTVGMYVTLEDLLTGRHSLNDYYQNILVGFEEAIYTATVEALRTASAVAPASHLFNVAGDAAGLNDTLDEAIRIARAYGDGVAIFGFSSEIAKIQNLGEYIVKEDRTDIREGGYVRLYKGVPVIELPNYVLTDGATASWAFKENELFILPSDAKPVKIALKGETLVQEYKEPTGGMQWNAEKMVGVGLLLADNVCIVRDTDNDFTGAY